MKATLIFPPAADPRAPHLGLAVLQAALRTAGHQVHIHDADLEGLRHLTSASELRRRAVALARGSGSDRRLLARAERIVEDVAEAYAIFASVERFLDPHERIFARDTLKDALEITCASQFPAVDYGFHPIRYTVAGIDERRLAALIDVSDKPEINVFEEHWRDELLPAIDEQQPDLVGLSIVNGQQLIPGLLLARRLKQRGLCVAIGGTLLAKFGDALQRSPAFFQHFADFVIVYDGETALLELLEQLQGRRDFTQVPNLLYRDRGLVRRTRVHVEDVRQWPTPDFTGFPLDRYLAPVPVLPVALGRGCYYDRCRFCDIPHSNRISPKRYRLREVDQVVEDLRTLAQRHGARHFVFTDEALPPSLLARLAEALPRPSPYSFVGYARLEPGFTPAVCEAIAAAGFRKLYFGMESGDQGMLDHMDKGTRVDDARPVLAACRDAGLRVHLFSIVGFPEETEAMARRTHGFFVDNQDVLDAPGNTFDLHGFGLELRTPYFDDRERYGIVVDEADLEAELVLGIADDRWSNTRGLSRPQVEALLELFNADLRARYHRWHGSLVELWPMHEEYAVIYCDELRDDADHGPRTSLPPTTDGDRWRLRWHRCATASPPAHGEERWWFGNRRAHVEVPPRLVDALGQSEFESAAALHSRLSRLPGLVDRIPGLFEVGLIELEREP